MAEPQLAVDPVATSNLSVKAPEFYPPGYNQNFNQNFTVSVLTSFLSMCQFTYIQINNVFLRSFMSNNLNSVFAEEIAKILMITSRVAARMLSGNG